MSNEQTPQSYLVRLLLNDQTPETAKKLEQTLADYYPGIRIEKDTIGVAGQSSSVWSLHIGRYLWAMNDAEFMKRLENEHHLIKHWICHKGDEIKDDI